MPTTVSSATCTCNAQMQPHAPLPNVCPEPLVMRLLSTRIIRETTAERVRLAIARRNLHG